jgi:hypothetical protein
MDVLQWAPGADIIAANGLFPVDGSATAYQPVFMSIVDQALSINAVGDNVRLVPAIDLTNNSLTQVPFAFDLSIASSPGLRAGTLPSFYQSLPTVAPLADNKTFMDLFTACGRSFDVCSRFVSSTVLVASPAYAAGQPVIFVLQGGIRVEKIYLSRCYLPTCPAGQMPRTCQRSPFDATCVPCAGCAAGDAGEPSYKVDECSATLPPLSRLPNVIPPQCEPCTVCGTGDDADYASRCTATADAVCAASAPRGSSGAALAPLFAAAAVSDRSEPLTWTVSALALALGAGLLVAWACEWRRLAKGGDIASSSSVAAAAAAEALARPAGAPVVSSAAVVRPAELPTANLDGIEWSAPRTDLENLRRRSAAASRPMAPSPTAASLALGAARGVVERTLGPGARAFLGLCSVASMLALALSLPASAAYMQLLLLVPSVSVAALFGAFASRELARSKGPSAVSASAAGIGAGASAGANGPMRCCPLPADLLALALALVHPLCGGALLALLPVPPSRENVMGRQWRWALAHAGLQVVPALFLLSRAQSSPRALAFVPECLVAPLIAALLAAAQMVRNRWRRRASKEENIEVAKRLKAAEAKLAAEAEKTLALAAALENATRARARAAPWGISGSEGPSLEAGGGSDRRLSAVTFSVDAELSDESGTGSLSEEPGLYSRGFVASRLAARVPTDSASAFTTRRPSTFSSAYPESSAPSDTSWHTRVGATTGASVSVGAGTIAGSSTGSGSGSGADVRSADDVEARDFDELRTALGASGGARSGTSPPRAQ